MKIRGKQVCFRQVRGAFLGSEAGCVRQGCLVGGGPALPSPQLCPSLLCLLFRRCFLQLEGLPGPRRCGVRGAPSTYGTCSDSGPLPWGPAGHASSLPPPRLPDGVYRPGGDLTGFLLGRLAQFLRDFGARFPDVVLVHFIRNEFGAVFLEIAPRGKARAVPGLAVRRQPSSPVI